MPRESAFSGPRAGGLASPQVIAPEAFAQLRISLTSGLGATLSARLIELAGSAEAACEAGVSLLLRVRGIGSGRAGQIAEGLRASTDRACEEIDLARREGARIITINDPHYPELLASIPDPPQVLYVRGSLQSLATGTFGVAMVGSRRCTSYGIEQAERFAGVLAQSGLVVVSGGARGIDTAAHRGAVRAGGRTIAVLGCGLCECYPPDNHDLFERIVESGQGTLVSELPMRTPPTAENFPARNRIISGLSLGVLVVEAGRRSGALITARQALEDQQREVMALPARVDNPLGEGSNDLLKRGEAAMVTSPGDVIQILETPARHHHAGTHAQRYGRCGEVVEEGVEDAAECGDEEIEGRTDEGSPGHALEGTECGRGGEALMAVIEALDRPASADTIVERTGLEVQVVRATLTMLEIQGRVRRGAGGFERTRS